ncbi:hypothetical protein DPMN_116550 [Dreissena polymorpha]|uniref:Uncharacterized protein n=1 Tax=Dreissena polymorpha TaxID=45954 RepID=A0A9D4QU20_DREPO|nr:hypothetical protein DPMN_116550 [Dreissena polymorpha]
MELRPTEYSSSLSLASLTMLDSVGSMSSSFTGRSKTGRGLCAGLLYGTIQQRPPPGSD